MDLVLSIVAVAEGCDPGNNRDIRAVLGLLLDCTLALDLCWKSCVLQVFGILSIWCSNVSICGDVCIVLMTAI